MKVELNADGNGIRIAQQTISVAREAIVGRMCTLIEAIISDNKQCGAAIKTAKGIIREEIDRAQSFLSMRARCNLSANIPDSYAREIITDDTMGSGYFNS